MDLAILIYFLIYCLKASYVFYSEMVLKFEIFNIGILLHPLISPLIFNRSKEVIKMNFFLLSFFFKWTFLTHEISFSVLGADAYLYSINMLIPNYFSRLPF